jgi:hypothetical protein
VLEGGSNSNWRDVNNNQLFHQFWLKQQLFTIYHMNTHCFLPLRFIIKCK